MDNFTQTLNGFLTSTFNSILKVEQDIIKHENNIPLSISELHLLEAVGKCGAGKNTIRDIAVMLDITMSSVTIAVNKLIAKGFLEKEKNKMDGRSVHITLTDQGIKMEEYHTFFHAKMIEHVTQDLNEEEKIVLMSGMQKLNKFFTKPCNVRENYILTEEMNPQEL